MNLSEMRTRLRRDLHDEDATSQRWTDAVLDRHIAHAVREFSLAVPLEAKSTLVTSAGSRDLSISSLTELVGVEAVEYPTGQYPPAYVRYSVWSATLTLLMDAAPSAGQNASVYYTRLHTLDASSSTIPPRFEDMVAIGAAAYAALEWASFATNRINAGGAEVWRQYLLWGQERLAEFTRSLARLARKNTARARRLYRPAGDQVSQSQVTGP